MADTYQVSIRLQPEAVRRAEGLADGWKVPRVDVLRRAIDAGLPVLEAEGLEAAPAAPEAGATLAEVLAEVRALRGELPDLVPKVEASPVRPPREDAGPLGLLIGAADALEAADALIGRAAASLDIHADDASPLLNQRAGVSAAASEVRKLLHKLGARVVASSPRADPTPDSTTPTRPWNPESWVSRPSELPPEVEVAITSYADDDPARPQERRADDRPVAGEWARRVGAGNRAYSHRLLRETAGGMAEVACGHENLALVELRRSPEGARLCPKCEAAAD